MIYASSLQCSWYPLDTVQKAYFIGVQNTFQLFDKFLSLSKKKHILVLYISHLIFFNSHIYSVNIIFFIKHRRNILCCDIAYMFKVPNTHNIIFHHHKSISVIWEIDHELQYQFFIAIKLIKVILMRS